MKTWVNKHCQTSKQMKCANGA